MGPDAPQLVMALILRQNGFFIEMKEELLENPQPQSSFAIAYSSNAIALRMDVSLGDPDSFVFS
jgi:hypothetical protein